MANRYGNLVGSKKISEDFQTINTGFDRVQAEMDTKGTPADAQAKADAAKAAAIAAAAADLAAHKARGADEHPVAKGNAAGFMSAADKLLVDARTSAATPDTLMQRDAAGRAKVAAPAATDDIARKAETDTVQANLDSHATDANIHVTAADHTKLNGIAAGAEVNQNAFAKVNDVEASSKSDTVTFVGGTGITVTTDPEGKRVVLTATGEATPGAHASSHITGGTDVIPDAVAGGSSGLMSGADAKFVREDGESKTGAQAKADAAKQAAIDVSLPRAGGALTGPLRISSWGEISASSGGYVLYGHNCYLDATGVVYRYRNTHANMGARGIVFRLGAGLQGAWMFDMGAIATTAGASFTPVLKRLLNTDDFNSLTGSIGNLADLQTTDKDNLVDALNEVFTHVDEGKELVKTAVIVKGGTVAGTSPHSFEELADGIETIETATVINGQQQVTRTYAETIAANDPVYTATSYNEDITVSSQPDGSIRSSCFSPDGVYLANASGSYPYICLFKRTGKLLARLAVPSVIPPDAGHGVDFSPDGTYLAVAHSTSPFLTIYKRTGDTFTKLANPSELPKGGGTGIDFSPDGTYLAVAHSTSPFLTIYKRTGDTFTKLTNPDVLPPLHSIDTSFNMNGTLLAVGVNGSPFLIVYKRIGDSFIKLPNPNVLPPSNCVRVAFSSENYLVGTCGNTTLANNVNVFKITDDYISKLGQLTNEPAASFGVCFNQTGDTMIIGASSSASGIFLKPYSLIYDLAYKSQNYSGDAQFRTGLGYALESGSAGDTKNIVLIWR